MSPIKTMRFPLIGFAALLIGVAVLVNVWAAVLAVCGQWLWSAVIFATVKKST